ncbi:LysR family transcriptional regulator [Pseudonocardia sp. CA-107938]|uniref:LysR family transcriptional regulator n=1 Tax=Pseudonocardia sp. CA-107938 TaxID=3240021 RepID=UPI003D93C249
MELRQLRVFEAVLRHGSVTEAAVALGLAPSSVSAQIRALEAGLGTALFERAARGMTPTAAGERLRPWARRLLTDAEQAAAATRGAATAVRLGALETIAAACVPAVLHRLGARRPDVAVHVHAEARRDVLLGDLAAGALDAVLLLDSGTALGELGFGVPAEPLAFIDVDAVPLVLVAAPGHPAAARDHLAPDDLAGEKLLVNAPGCSFRMAAEAVFGPAVARVPAGGVAVMRAWAEQRLGIAVLPRFAVEDALAAGTLVALPLPLGELALRLVWDAAREAQVPGLRDVLYAAC